MWIARANYEALLRDRVRLESEVESNKGIIARLEKELDYWRGKFEGEQARADRVNDRLMETSGFAPVSETGIREVDEWKKKTEELMKGYMKQNTEMFADELPGEEVVEIDENLLGEVVKGFRE